MFRLRFDEAGGDDVVAVAFEDYLWERLWWRAVENRAVVGGEDSAVAGAPEDAVRGLVKHRARVVSAETAERYVGVFRGAEEEAGAVVGGIRENLAAADGDFSGLGDYFCWVAGFVFLPVVYQRSYEREGAGGANPFVEAAAGDGGNFFAPQPLVIRFINDWPFCGVFSLHLCLRS